jgi:hypothetical protein
MWAKIEVTVFFADFWTESDIWRFEGDLYKGGIGNVVDKQGVLLYIGEKRSGA